MAEERGLPADWLNTRARAWMPPLPADALRHGRRPGLRITYASEEFLFATKLIAQRRQHASDLRLLAQRLSQVRPAADFLESIIRRYYTDLDALEIIIGGGDLDGEIRLLAERAARMLVSG
jgi:hypothetical protein